MVSALERLHCILIILNEKLLFLFMFVRIYSNIVSFRAVNRIRSSPMEVSLEGRGLILNNKLWHGGLFEGGLNRGEDGKSRIYGKNHLSACYCQF